MNIRLIPTVRQPHRNGSCRFVFSLILILLELCITSVNASDDIIERTIEKAFPVQSAGTVRLATEAGTIRVRSSSDPTVKIVLTEKFRTTTESEVAELSKRLVIVVEQQEADVIVSAKYAGPRPMFQKGSWPPVLIDITVTVPRSFGADVKTAGGSTAVGDLAGSLRAFTGGGNVNIGKIGGDVTVSSGGGTISLAEGGASIDLTTGGGSVTVGRAVGPAKLRADGGSINVESIGRSVQASSAGGNVRLNFAGPLENDCQVDTAGGSIDVAVDSSAAFQLQAAARGGTVGCKELNINLTSGASGKSVVEGMVNGGGPLLKLRAEGGHIEISSR